MAKKIIIITDLDGTLLHPGTYSFDAAQPALDLIKNKKIPLILCSSKTRVEMEVYEERLDNRAPFISENGGGICIPADYFGYSIEGEPADGYTVITLGEPYSTLRGLFQDLRSRTGIRVRGFGDMETEEVAFLTNLPLSDAELAKEREFDEPFIFEEGEERIREFLGAIEEAGLYWTQGRFYHILGDNDKGKAVRVLKGIYEKSYGEVETIGLGDSFNDLPLLRSVDYPVLIQKEDGSYEERIEIPNLIREKGIGPEGWNRAVLRLIR